MHLGLNLREEGMEGEGEGGVDVDVKEVVEEVVVDRDLLDERNDAAMLDHSWVAVLCPVESLGIEEAESVALVQTSR